MNASNNFVIWLVDHLPNVVGLVRKDLHVHTCIHASIQYTFYSTQLLCALSNQKDEVDYVLG